MKKYNNVTANGRLYDYKLEVIDTDKGEAIAGTVTLEVDADGTTCEGRFFARPTYNSGKPNRTYDMLEDIMAGNYKTVVNEGDDASWLGFTGNIDVSYFAGRNGAKDPDDLIRSQKIRASFLNANGKHQYTNKWVLDMFITKITEVEADEEKGIPHMVYVSGYGIDDYNERMIEVQFESRKETAVNYFVGMAEGVSVDNPVHTQLWGGIMRVVRTIVRANCIGDDTVEESISSKWAIAGMDANPYDFPDERTMTLDEYKQYRDGLEEFRKSEFERATKGNDNKGEGLAF